MSTIKLRNSVTTGAVPSSLVQGEVAINEADGLLFYRNSSGAVVAMPLVGKSDNLLINGGAEVDQEFAGTTKAITAVATPGSTRYLIDSFACSRAGLVALNSQQVSDAPAGLKKSIKLTVTTADSSIAATDRCLIGTSIEGYRCQRLGFGAAGAKTITIGFFVKAHRAGTYSGSIQNNNGDRSYPFSFTVNAADTWEYKTVTINGDTTGTWEITNLVGMYINWCIAAGSNYLGTANAWVAGDIRGVTGTVNGIAATTDTFQVTGVVVLEGKFVPPSYLVPKFIRPFNEELGLCERYYQKSYNYGTAPGTATRVGEIGFFFAPLSSAAQNASLYADFRVRLRTTPTMTIYSPSTGGSGLARDWTGAQQDVTATVSNISEGHLAVDATTAAATSCDLSFHFAADARM